MKKFFFLSFAMLFITVAAYTQGCVIVRNISGFGQYNLTDNAFSTSNWQMNVTTRYFKSFRDYKGTTDQKTPAINQSINHVFSMDISISRILDKGWSFNFSLPITSNSRSATTEHGGANTTRHITHSFGIGDIRFVTYKWLIAPTVKQKINFQLGLGIKLPTGDYKYQDYFYKNDSTKTLAPVNPSIQLGDGGTGIITELNTFYIFNKHISLYGNLYYLINPREQNGTSATTGKTATTLQIKTGSDINSVPDIYSMRAGAIINFEKVSFSVGIRKEGIPVNDVVGGSNGNRRAGYNLSFEPGIIYKMKKMSVYAYVPVIMSRKIKQSVPDKLATKITGVETITQGGFADYLVFIGAQVKF
ncbi:MAG: hypothetical protein JWN83_1172 [Chitinophagaceae bacterium]|nr:hypothetical protein [Chitinophagaceae bacterium]